MRATNSVAFAACLLLGSAASHACSAFVISNGRTVLACNNEDYWDPFTRMWFVPAEKGKFGRLYVGYDNFFPQGGMNEKGLWFDGFATAAVDMKDDEGKPVFQGNLSDEAMATCATVEKVAKLFTHYSRRHLKSAVLMFADAKGNSIVVEPNAILFKKGRFQVQTNFHQSFPKPEMDCPRFKAITEMLTEAGDKVTLELGLRGLAAAHAEGQSQTMYSNICDLKRGLMYLYDFHNYTYCVTIDLKKELRKGGHSVEIPSLFPKTYAAEEYRAKQAKALDKVPPKPVEVDAKTLDEYAGKYAVLGWNALDIRRDGKQLVIQGAPFYSAPAYMESSTAFYMPMMNLHATFTRGVDGKVKQAHVKVMGAKLVAVRVGS